MTPAPAEPAQDTDATVPTNDTDANLETGIEFGARIPSRSSRPSTVKQLRGGQNGQSLRDLIAQYRD